MFRIVIDKEFEISCEARDRALQIQNLIQNAHSIVVKDEQNNSISGLFKSSSALDNWYEV